MGKVLLCLEADLRTRHATDAARLRVGDCVFPDRSVVAAEHGGYAVSRAGGRGALST
ncbi:hypothetical protein D9M71_435900 [compost metagenome]